MSQAIKKASILDSHSSELSESLFESLSKKIYQMAGLYLPYNEKNLALMKESLEPLLKDYQLKNFSELNDRLRVPEKKLKQVFISSLTNNKTEFFREEGHFQFLKKHFKELLKTQDEIRVWSSACSIGSEPYSLAMMVHEAFKVEVFKKIKILATDIDTHVLQKAIQGRFTLEELEGLSLDYKQKYFKPLNNQIFEILPELTKKIQFSEFNLMNFHYRFQKKFDIIICRNILIHFDKKTTDQVLDLLVKNLELKGQLIIGHSESGVVLHPCLKALGNSVFQKVRN